MLLKLHENILIENVTIRRTVAKLHTCVHYINVCTVYVLHYMNSELILHKCSNSLIVIRSHLSYYPLGSTKNCVQSDLYSISVYRRCSAVRK